MPDPTYSNVVNLLQLAIMLLIPLEILLAATLRIKADYEMRDTVATMMVSVGSIYLWGVLGWLFFGGVLFAYAHRLFNMPFTWWTFRRLRARGLPLLLVAPYQSPFALVLGFSCSPSLQSTLQPVGESAAELDLAVQRLDVLGVPLAWLGFHPASIALAFSLNLLYQFSIHAEAIDRMPRWFEALLNTPSHHRVHHASNPRYLDANYAGVFMIWIGYSVHSSPKTGRSPRVTGW